MAQNKSTITSNRNMNSAQAKKRAARVSLVAQKLNALTNRAKAKAPQTAIAPFRGVSEVSVAPVSLGNTVRSIKQTVVPIPNGIKVVGRDFVQTLAGVTTAYTGWVLSGGFALSPMSLNATGLRGFFQTYEQYRWDKCVAHYITSSPTSLPGDVLMVYHSNHGGPKVDHTSSNFLSYALSTDSALIGPQWTNHSVEIITTPHEWFGTDVLNAEDVAHQADGELLVYTRNTTNGTQADAPGYLLIDYEVSFRRRMLNARVQTLPSSLFKWRVTGLHVNTATAVNDIVSTDFLLSAVATNGVPVIPPGAAIGDIFQIVIDTQAAVVANTTLATAWRMNIGGTGDPSVGTYIVLPIVNGMTIYGVIGSVAGNGSIALFPNYDAVFSGVNTIRWNVGAAGVILDVGATVCCVGSVNSVFMQANIG